MFSRTLLFRQILSGLKRFPADKPCNIPHLSVGRLVFTDGFCFVGSFVGQPEGDQAITLCGPLHLVTETSRALHCWDCATWPSGNSGYFFIVSALSHIKRFRGTKASVLPIWFRVKRFIGTKLYGLAEQD